MAIHEISEAAEFPLLNTVMPVVPGPPQPPAAAAEIPPEFTKDATAERKLFGKAIGNVAAAPLPAPTAVTFPHWIINPLGNF